jgi:hypothetical protein
MRRLAAFTITLALGACDSSTYHVAGPYYVVSIDSGHYELEYDLDGEAGGGMIGRTAGADIFKYGSNDQYIVIASHSGPSGETIEYYYLIRARDTAYDSRSLQGPFDAAAFTQETARLHLPPLDHDVR